MKPVAQKMLNDFIKKSGDSRLDNDMASYLAGIGDRIILAAMHQGGSVGDQEEYFNHLMKDLEVELTAYIQREFPSMMYPTSIYIKSEMACCLLYAQTKAHCQLGLAPSKDSTIYQCGTNINGDKNDSAIATKRLMDYFSKPDPKAPNQVHGYDDLSTHVTWRSSVESPPIRIDIEGRIPAPFKGIHSLHLASGVDTDNATKLLVKPENWGTKQLLHKILNALESLFKYIASCFKRRKEEESVVTAAEEPVVTAAIDKLKEDIKQLNDPSLKELFRQLSDTIDSARSAGFDKPLEKIKEAWDKLDEWIKTNPKHEKIESVQIFQQNLNDQHFNVGVAGISNASISPNKEPIRIKYDSRSNRDLVLVNDTFTHKFRKMREQMQSMRQSSTANQSASENDKTGPQFSPH